MNIKLERDKNSISFTTRSYTLDAVSINKNFVHEQKPPHMTKYGDTLESVARQHNISVQKIKEWNNYYASYDAKSNLPEGLYLVVSADQFKNAGKYEVVATSGDIKTQKNIQSDPTVYSKNIVCRFRDFLYNIGN